MAKKGKTTKKKAEKKKAAPKKAAKARKPGPRSQTFPEMEQVRSALLDSLCEEMAEDRETINAAKVRLDDNAQGALTEMVKRGIPVYKHAGLALSRVPGAEKLSVRLSKDHGDAGAADLAQPEPDADAPPF